MQGYAPDWQVRCVRCGVTRAAAAVGVVRVGAWSWNNRTVGWCSSCHRPTLLAVERAPALAGVESTGLDDDFSPPAAKAIPGASRRVGATFAWVAAALYLPFCWVVLAGPALARFPWPARWLLWPILPGFLPSAYLFHPHDALMWASSAVLSLGLLVGLTRLGTRGWWQFGLALGLALLVAVPTSALGYVLIVLN